MSDTDPSRYRINAMVTTAVEKLQAQFDAALEAFTTRMNDELALASAAIEASSEDRAGLHTTIDGLTATVDDLTTRVATLEAAAPVKP